MNIYDMFRRMADSTAMPAGEVADCHALIDNLERINAFGTVASITNTTHEYRPGVNASCGICGVKENKHE